MAKETYARKHNMFRLDIIEKLKFKACKSATQSKHMNTSVLMVKDCQFNLSGGRYLTEVSQHELLDESGYRYDFNVLDTEQLCELADELLK